MELTPALRSAFKDLLGPKGAIENSDEIQPHVQDWRGNYKGHSPLLLKPASTEEVSEVLKLCSANNLAVTPQSGNTGLVNGGVAYGELVLSTQRMDKIRAIDPHNNSMDVDAGCILQSVHTAASDANRFFPLHLGSQGSARIGGLISTNAGGVAVLRYGMMRDLILGLEVVLADGRIWNGLNGLRKDNTGYDLKHLFCGAEGTLGIITGASLKLFPVPKTATAWLVVETVEKAVELLSHVRNEVGDAVTGFEFMPRTAVELTTKEIETARDPLPHDAEWRILLEVSLPSEDQARASLESAVEKAFEADLILDGTIAQSVAQSDDFWTVRESIPMVKRTYMTSVNHDVSVPVSKVSEFLKRSGTKLQEMLPGTEAIAFGHLGDGNIHYSIAERADAENARVRKQASEITEIVHAITTELGGSISAEHGIGLLKRDELPLHKSAVEMELMRTLKSALDPQNIMNPGRILTTS